MSDAREERAILKAQKLAPAKPFTVAHRGHCPWHDTTFIEWRPGEFCCAICAQEGRTTIPAADGHIARLEAELARLQPYVQHKSTCDVRTGKGGGLSENIIVMPKCTCGLIPKKSPLGD